jgi:hypothetical protein
MQQAPGATAFPETTAAPSRGALTTDFLTSDVEPLAYLQVPAGGRPGPGLAHAARAPCGRARHAGAAARAPGPQTRQPPLPPPGPPQSLRTDYMGVSVAVGDLTTGAAAFVCNRDGRPPRPLPPGAYGVSNGFLGCWPKVEHGLARLQEVLGASELAGTAGAGAGRGRGYGGVAALLRVQRQRREQRRRWLLVAPWPQTPLLAFPLAVPPDGELPWDQLFGPGLMGDPATVEDPAKVGRRG